jgi:signal transduction histidine kinase
MPARQVTDWPSRAKRAEARVAALDLALAAIARELDVDRVLQLIVDQVRRLSGAQYAALGIANRDGRIHTFITAGISAEARRRIGALPSGHGLLGALIHEGTSIRLAEASEDPRSIGVPAHHFPVHAFLGVPIHVRGRPVGNLYLVNKRGGLSFTADDQEFVERFADHAGIAIDNARLLAQVQRLAVVEERERIGRELHDSVIQRLYGISLSLEDVPEMVAESPAEVNQRVDRAIEALHAAIGDIRTFIYGLRPPLLAPGDLRRSLVDLADEVSRAASVSVDVDAPDLPISAEHAAEVVAIAREALSNVARHAAATRAKVQLTVRVDQLRLVIADNGQGFTTGGRRAHSHHGLSNMRDRATALGGRTMVRSTPGTGTRIIVTLPIDR